MTAYTAKATREGGWWALEVPGLELATQCRRLDQAEATVRDLIATWLEIPADSFTVTVTHELDEVTTRSLNQVRQKQTLAAQATEAASAAVRTFARRLQEQGYTVRDVGAILGVSPQRVSQLTTGPEPIEPVAKSPAVVIGMYTDPRSAATAARAIASSQHPSTASRSRRHVRTRAAV